MKDQGTRDMRQRTLTKALLERQQSNEPVHRWPIIKIDGTEEWGRSYQTVGQFMSTDLFTVQPDDLIDMAASVMDWQRSGGPRTLSTEQQCFDTYRKMPKVDHRRPSASFHPSLQHQLAAPAIAMAFSLQ